MKHKKGAVFFLLLVGTIVFVAAMNTPEKRTIHYFHSHRAALENEVLHSFETGSVGSELDLTFNYWGGEHPIMEYIVVSSGIVPASKYYGFFYSFDDAPVSFQNSGVPLTPVSEQEWEWHGAGDNHGTVRRLDTNWFYFEAAL